MGTASSKPIVEIIWKIENFSYWHQLINKPLCSPHFKLRNSETYPDWRLKLLPLSIDTDTVCFLEHQAPAHSSSVTIDVEFSLLDENNVSLIDKYVKFAVIPCSSGGLVILKEKDKYLPNGVLTVRCRVCVTGEKRPETEKIYFRSYVPISVSNFDWHLKNFTSSNSGNSKIIVSPVFGHEREMTVELSYKMVESQQLVNVVSSGTGFVSSFHVDLYIAGRQEKFLQHDFKCIKQLPHEEEIKPLISREEILLNKNKFLFSNTLVLRCEFVFVSHELLSQELTDPLAFPEYKSLLNKNPPIVATTSTEADKNNPIIATISTDVGNFSKRRRVENNENSLNQELYQLYIGGDLSNFKIQVGDRIFNVHSAVLAARSPVFKQMMFSEMLEKKRSLVEISDLDSETVAIMLDYIYSDTVHIRSMEAAFKLYYATDKYEIPGLKKEVSTYVESNVTPYNLFDVFELADLHEDSELTAAAIECFEKHEKSLLASEEFSAFRKKNAPLTAEIMTSIAKSKF